MQILRKQTFSWLLMKLTDRDILRDCFDTIEDFNIYDIS